MSLERKPESTQQTESSTIQGYMHNPENTMNSFVQRSMGMAMLRLADRYCKNKTDEQVDQMCADTIAELNKLASDSKDQEVKAGIEHALTIADKPTDYWDRVRLYLPIPGTDPVEYKDVEYVFPLKQVLTLSWTALNDDEQFAHHATEAKETALPAKAARRENMFHSFKTLREEKPCHVGHRHQFLFPISQSAKDVQVIADEKITILKFLKENIYPLFWAKWNAPTTSDAMKKQLLSALYEWMLNQNLSELIALVDPEKTLLSSLKNLFLQHGCNPSMTEKEYDLAIKSILFEPDSKFPVLTHLHQLLTAEEIINQESYNDAIAKMKDWLLTQFDFLNKQHHEWVKKFHAVQQAQYLLNQYSFLLTLTGKRAEFISLEKYLQHYFTNFKTNFLVDVPDEILTTIKSLEAAIAVSKKSTLADQVENFFAHWYEAQQRHDTNKLNYLYSMLLSADFQNKIYLTDATIQQFIDKAQAESKDGKLDFGPYHINRFFLHAITILPAYWTTIDSSAEDSQNDLFTSHLQVVVKFVRNYFNEGNRGIAGVLKRDSYPEELIGQIEYLINVRKKEPAERRPVMIVLPEHVKTAEEWITICKWMDAATKEKVYPIYETHILQVFLNDPSGKIDLYQFSRTIPSEKLARFYKNITSPMLVKLLNTSYYFLSFITLLPIDEREPFLSRFCPRELRITHWELADLIKLLPADKITEFLARFKQEHLRELFNNERSLAGMLANLPNEHWEYFLNLLGENHLNRIFTFSADTLSSVFNTLATQDKLEKFISIIGNERLRKIVTSEDELYSLLAELPKNYIEKFLKENIGSDALNRIFFQSRARDHEKRAFLLIREHLHSPTKKAAILVLALKIAENPEYSNDLPLERDQSNYDDLLKPIICKYLSELKAVLDSRETKIFQSRFEDEKATNLYSGILDRFMSMNSLYIQPQTRSIPTVKDLISEVEIEATIDTCRIIEAHLLEEAARKQVPITLNLYLLKGIEDDIRHNNPKKAFASLITFASRIAKHKTPKDDGFSPFNFSLFKSHQSPQQMKTRALESLEQHTCLIAPVEFIEDYFRLKS